MKTEWIKCSERMPEPGEHVDIWAAGYHNERLANYRLIKDFAGKKGNDFFEPVYSGYTCVRCATHWMPLPQPPEST